LSITPAGGLRLCKARGISINGVNNCNEPEMQDDQWGEAGSAADGVCSNEGFGRKGCSLMYVYLLWLASFTTKIEISVCIFLKLRSDVRLAWHQSSLYAAMRTSLRTLSQKSPVYKVALLMLKENF
jgi:hypothetical protein